jgi:hypothetical protein
MPIAITQKLPVVVAPGAKRPLRPPPPTVFTRAQAIELLGQTRSAVAEITARATDVRARLLLSSCSMLLQTGIGLASGARLDADALWGVIETARGVGDLLARDPTLTASVPGLTDAAVNLQAIGGADANKEK